MKPAAPIEETNRRLETPNMTSVPGVSDLIRMKLEILKISF
jgi:hypothetical protein